MLDKIRYAINNLVDKPAPYAVNNLEKWLLENQEIYNYCQIKKKSNSCFEDISCGCGVNSEEHQFSSIYDKVSEAIELHAFEDYAKKELALFESISTDKTKVKEWLIKNEKIASEYLATFLIYCFEDSEIENDNADFLVYRSEEQNSNIFINRSDYQNLIEFKELFDELYFIQQLYPEGIKRIQDEISKLPTSVSF